MSLRVENLSVFYQTLRGDVRALDGATFTVADGEIMGLAGESGCGKSTLGNSMVLLSNTMRYVAGTVELDGEELPIWDRERMRPWLHARVSLIPQYAMSALNPTRKIGKMISDLLAPRKISYREALPELVERLKLVDLDPAVLTMYPIELSGGMKQRVVMVLSTILNPSLLIADEITSALDVSTQRAVAEMVVEFRDRGYVKSVILITHDVSILSQIADSILIMYAGKLAEKAPTESIIDEPKHPYTRMLISSLPQIGARHADRRLEGIPGTPPLLLDPPSGCRFRDRCPRADEKCGEEPPFVEIDDAHLAACWRVIEDHAQA
ncbi:MAG: ABC transporter ATP-binding protein [Actinomycetota bacterium]